MADEVVPANSIMFSDFCSMLEKIHKKNKTSEKCQVLEEFINDFRNKAANVSAEKKNCTIFPILRLLLPKLERDRKSYDMKENRLGNLLVEVLMVKKTSSSAQKLINSNSNISNDNDFASRTVIIVKNLIQQKPSSLTIGDVNEALDQIASAETESRKQNQIDAFSNVIKKLTAENFKWFLRIILKDMKLGLGHDKILATFHPDAPDLYDTCSSLSKICDEFEDGNARPLEMGVQIFYAVTPMLLEKLNTIDKLPADKIYQVEIKFDGERFQMHMENNVFEYFSKKGKPYSHQFGKSYDSGLLTPRLKNSFKAHVKSCILDGEMMGWRKEHQRFGTKGMNYDIKKITDKSKFTACFCVYDVLYYNGACLVGPPENGGRALKHRLEMLNEMFTDVPGAIQHSESRIIDRSDILDALNKSVADDEEGIVVKDIDSYYIPRRRNAGWYKMKAEYFKGAMTELDLVIIGVDGMENNIRGNVKCFYVACVQEDVSGRSWYCMGSVASGLTNAEREPLYAKLEEHWTRTKLTPPPDHLHFNKAKPDFWILPEQSTVLQIRASKLVWSSKFATSHTLWFPRIVKLRDDKPVQDVMTLQEFKEMVDEMGSVVKLYKDQDIQEQTEGNSSSSILRERRKRPAQVLKVPDDLKVDQGSGDEGEVTSLLQGKKILVLTGDEECSEQALMKIIKQHGGKVVCNWGPDTWCCVAGSMNRSVHNHMAAGVADVVRAGWVRALLAAPAPPAPRAPPPPRALLAASRRTRLLLARSCDRYFDSYTEPIDYDDLMIRFQIIDYDKSQICLTTEEMMTLDRELFDDTNPYSFLRGCFIHMEDERSLSAFDARMFGAELCALDQPNLTHVVVPNAHRTPPEICNKNALIVTKEWLDRCIVERKKVSEENYILL